MSATYRIIYRTASNCRGKTSWQIACVYARYTGGSAQALHTNHQKRPDKPLKKKKTVTSCLAVNSFIWSTNTSIYTILHTLSSKASFKLSRSALRGGKFSSRGARTFVCSLSLPPGSLRRRKLYTASRIMTLNTDTPSVTRQ